MVEIRRILCPIDFSEFSRGALDHALPIARWYEAAVTVMYVHPDPVAAYGAGPIGAEAIAVSLTDLAQIHDDLQRFIEPESARGIAIDTVVHDGKPAAEILKQATTINADLLVMGSHGRSGFERLVLGSVTEKVLRKAACPVLTVPRRLPHAASAGPVLFKEILCPVDFSQGSMDALNMALSLAQEADGHLTIVHVLTSDLADVPDISVGGEHLSLAAFQRQYEDQARRRLEEAVPDTVAAYCRVESLMVRGKPWREIIRIASEHQADLIVMGVQGRGAVDLMLFGSTTQQVIRESGCPVLTLR